MLVVASARRALVIDTSGGDVSNVDAMALYIGTAGDVTVDTIGGSINVTFSNVPVGFFPVQVKKVYQTGTTATDIIALSW